MRTPPPTPEPVSRPDVRLTVQVPARLADLLRARARERGVSVAEEIRLALWNWFGQPGDARRKG